MMLRTNPLWFVMDDADPDSDDFDVDAVAAAFERSAASRGLVSWPTSDIRSLIQQGHMDTLRLL
jgi:hypothetical protein